MIKSIDIGKFGQFQNYKWADNIDRGYSFQKLNIIYGRNYSGKTTLSRIVSCLDKKEVHENYRDGVQFKINFENGSTTESNINEFDGYKIRVYNSDFVTENLNWLRSKDGIIQPFAVLGEANVAIEKEIEEINNTLGSVEENRGLSYDYENCKTLCKNTEYRLSELSSTLENELRNKAKEIKNNSLYNYPTYIITSIQYDLPNASPDKILEEIQIATLKSIVREEKKENISLLDNHGTNFSSYLIKTRELLAKEIKPSQPIVDLLGNSLLQEWVRNGVNLHRNTRSKCGFCGGVISNDLWNTIDEHFNKESEQLRKQIFDLVQILKRSLNNISSYVRLNEHSFYTSLHLEFKQIFEKWTNVSNVYRDRITSLINALEKREQDIFNVIEIESVEDVSQELNDVVLMFNDLIVRHNEMSSILKEKQDEAKLNLRLSEVALFLKNIDYLTRTADIEKVEKEYNLQLNNLSNLNEKIQELIARKKLLESKRKDEKRGADLVNYYLNNFFGHDGLMLDAETAGNNVKFVIKRHGVPAKNFSDGEASLISFCYFIAKIHDDLSEENLLIYIDDPISSLDNNHIFYMFGLIDTIIAKPQKYSQLFISTHNLDFLKYLKKLTKPQTVAYFMTERRQQKNIVSSFVIRMPDYLKEYVTEFHFLFKEIYKVYSNSISDDKISYDEVYSTFYNLPNNMRKFLEYYLFYKYPTTTEPLKKLPLLFNGTVPSQINRVINELSHLVYIDRGWKPMDVSEIEDCARILIEKIKENDNVQYNALCEAINVVPI
jgi:wobble nucleotide-excising tRNase